MPLSTSLLLRKGFARARDTPQRLMRRREDLGLAPPHGMADGGSGQGTGALKEGWRRAIERLFESGETGNLPRGWQYSGVELRYRLL